MLEARGETDFLLEAVGAQAERDLRMEELQRDRAIVAQIVREEDRGESAATELALEPVLCAERLRQRLATRHRRDYTGKMNGARTFEEGRRAKASGERRRSQPADEEVGEQVRDRLGGRRPVRAIPTRNPVHRAKQREREELGVALREHSARACLPR